MTSGWQIYLKALSEHFKNQSYSCNQVEVEVEVAGEKEKGLYYKCSNGRYSFIIIPLPDIHLLKKEKRNITTDGPVIFLISHEHALPKRENFKYHPYYPHLEKILGISKYGNVDKAIYMAEVLFFNPKECSKENCSCPAVANSVSVSPNDSKAATAATNEELSPMNILNIRNGHEAILKDIENICEKFTKNNEFFVPCEAFSLTEYYKLFVNGYDIKINDSQTETIINLSNKNIEVRDVAKYFSIKDINGKLDGILECAEKIYRRLNGMSEEGNTHWTMKDLFRLPIPFYYDDLRRNISLIKKEDKAGTIQLLLIDNKTDKLVGLKDILDNIGKNIFELKMLGLSEKEKVFDAQKFTTDSAYSENIYEAIHKHHFILLDFYLDDGGTYLAHDLIRKISDMKKEKGNIARVWYFVTSAVFDSVMKYSESGYLAESCDLSVVHAGDDPISSPRRIIFAYKLLTFIQARLQRFSEDWKRVTETLLLCSKKKCTALECQKNIYHTIEKLLIEYDNIADICISDKKTKEIKKEILQRFKDILDNFQWLPEADWTIIQQQIGLVNARINYIPDLRGQRFSCTQITKTLVERSEIY